MGLSNKILLTFSTLLLSCFSMKGEDLYDVNCSSEYQSCVASKYFKLISSNICLKSKCHESESEGAKPDRIQCLVEQVIEYGGETNKLSVFEFSPGNNGFVATEDIAIGELVTYIPFDLLMTLD